MAATALPPPDLQSVPAWMTFGSAAVCGYVDAYTLLTFKVFTSFMSGNTVSAGLDAGQGKFGQAGHTLLPIPFFLLGAFAGTLVQREKSRWQLSRMFILVAAALAAAVAAAGLGAPGLPCIAILSAAMGMMNTTNSHAGRQSVNLGFVTGDLKSLAEQAVAAFRHAPVPNAGGPWDTHWRRASLLAGTWAAFLGGAGLGSVAASSFGPWTLLAPALALLVFARTARPAVTVGHVPHPASLAK